MKPKLQEVVTLGKKAVKKAQETQVKAAPVAEPPPAKTAPVVDAKATAPKAAKLVKSEKPANPAKISKPPKASKVEEPVSIKSGLAKLRQTVAKLGTVAGEIHAETHKDPTPEPTPADVEQISPMIQQAAVRRPAAPPKKEPAPTPSGKISFAELQQRMKENTAPAPTPLFDATKYFKK